jgi:hypothetical protein
MQIILSASKRNIDYTLFLSFPDGTSFPFATSPLTIDGIPYTNDLENVREIYQTLESPTDSVGVAVQNKDGVLGLHVAAHWQKWRKAEAVIGRLYQDADGLLQAWIEMFRGAVQQPNADDLQVTFDVVPDTIAPGDIVCNQTLAVPCGNVFKDPHTCAYVGPETACNHHLKSKGGCDGRENSHHFGGMEHRYNPDLSVPGTGSNTGGGPITGCPRLDQYVLARGRRGEIIPKMVGFVTEEDYLWNPRSGRFHKVKSVQVIPNVPIFETVASNGAVSYSSGSHRVIQSDADERGEAVSRIVLRSPLMTIVGGEMCASFALMTPAAEEIGDVLKIEMADGHIYAAGSTTDKFIIAHNSKLPIE